MIDTFLDVIFYFAKGAISLLPTYDPGYHDAIKNAGTALRTFNQYFPVVEMFQMISIWLTVYVLIIVIRPILSFVHLR